MWRFYPESSGKSNEPTGVQRKTVRDGWRIQRRIGIISHDIQLSYVKEFGDDSTPYSWAGNVMNDLTASSTWHAKEGGKGVQSFKEGGEGVLILLGRWEFVIKILENFHITEQIILLLFLKNRGDEAGSLITLNLSNTF